MESNLQPIWYQLVLHKYKTARILVPAFHYLDEDTHEEEAVLAKIIHARPTNILILRKISLLYSPPPVAYSSAAALAIAAPFILATALSVSWRSGSPPCFGMKENQ